MEHAEPLPIEGWCELDVPIERMWDEFTDVRRWSAWNPCVWRGAWVLGRELRVGARLAWFFNPIERRYLYKMPAIAQIVDLERCDRMTWEARVPGFRAVHSYRFASLGPTRCRFGSWEVAEGAAFRATRRFWLAHFRYVCQSSIAGAERLADRIGPPGSQHL